MSMIHFMPELPKENSIVYAKSNDSDYSDRCHFINGEFHGGGEYPVPKYEMTNINKWFYLNEYSEYFKSERITSYVLSFEIAERIGYIKSVSDIIDTLSDFEKTFASWRNQPDINNLENKLYDLKRTLEEKINDKIC